MAGGHVSETHLLDMYVILITTETETLNFDSNHPYLG